MIDGITCSSKRALQLQIMHKTNKDIFKRGNNKRINPDCGTSHPKLRWSGGVTAPFPAALLCKT